MEQENHAYKGHKPAANHPWKRSGIVNKEISDWAREKSTYAHVENFKVGGGKPQK